MSRLISAISVCLLTACSANQQASWWQRLGETASAHEHYQYDFNWHLVGDEAVAPLQVFSNSQQVWLQFSSALPRPAIFSDQGDGLRLLEPQAKGNYWVISPAASILYFSLGKQKGWAYHIQAEQQLYAQLQTQLAQHDNTISTEAVAEASAGATQVVDHTVADLHAAMTLPVAEEVSTALAITPVQSSTLPLSGPVTTAVTNVPRASPGVTATTISNTTNEAALDSAKSETPLGDKFKAVTTLQTSVASYEVRRNDEHLRAVLQRWAHNAGWVFENQHWAVEVDYPISGSFQFEGEFTSAVQSVLASTALSTYPLQPCFYSNQVLRVIYHTQNCNSAMHREAYAAL